MSLEYKAIIKPDGTLITEVIKHDGNCDEIQKLVSRIGTIESDERLDDDHQPVHETVNS